MIQITSLNIVQLSGLIVHAFSFNYIILLLDSQDGTRHAGTSLEKAEDVIFAGSSLHFTPAHTTKLQQSAKTRANADPHSGKAKTFGQRKTKLYNFQLHLLAEFLIRVADIIPLVSLELIFFLECLSTLQDWLVPLSGRKDVSSSTVEQLMRFQFENRSVYWKKK